MTEQLQLLLCMLKELDAVCRKHGIAYYLYGGTCLGALRHRGFIPWDDDADIIMTRDNLNRLLSLPAEEFPAGRILVHDDVVERQGIPIVRYMNKDTAEFFAYHTMYHNPAGIMIDIDILDPAPSDPAGQLRHIQELTAYTEAMSQAYSYAQRRTWKMPEDIVRRRKQLPLEQFLKETKRAFTSYPEEGCEYLIARWAAVPHIFSAKLFGKPRYVPFEDTYLPVPEQAEACLRQMYMDEWWRLPPAVDRSLHTGVHNLYVPYDVYYRDIGTQTPTERIAKIYRRRNRAAARFGEFWWHSRPKFLAFAGRKLRMELERQLEQSGETVRALLDAGNYDRLSVLLDGYLQAQCHPNCIGNVTYGGWPRRNHPLLVEQDEDTTEAIAALLLQQDQISRADRVLLARRLTGAPLTAGQERLVALIAGIRAAGDAYFAGEYRHARQLCETWLEEFPGNPELLRLYCTLLYRQGDAESAQQLQTELEHALRWHPADDALRYIRAELSEQKGDTAAADAVYLELAEHAENGYVLLKLQEKMQNRLADREDAAAGEILRRARYRSGIREEAEDTPEQGDAQQNAQPEPATPDEPPREPRPGSPAAVSFRLLKEIDDICRRRHIRYYLGGTAALAAKTNGSLPDGFVDGYVLMTADACRKFLQAFDAERPAGRRLDSMRDNPDFPGFYLRYTDDDSLLCNINTYQCYRGLGIPVYIHILRGWGTSKWRRRFLSLLETGRESLAWMPWYTPKRQLITCFVNGLNHVVGKRRSAALLFQTLLREAGRGEGREYRVRMPWRGSKMLRQKWLKRGAEATLYGHAFRIPADTEAYLACMYGRDWAEKGNAHKSGERLGTVCSTQIPWKAYWDSLPQALVQEFPRLQRAYNDAQYRTNYLNKKIDKYWAVVQRTHDRILLAMYYLPQKGQIVSWFENGEYDALYDCLQPYLKLLRQNTNRGLSLNFDEQLFRIAIAVLKEQDQFGLAGKAWSLAKRERHPFVGLELTGEHAEQARRWAQSMLQ